ncbi:MAG: hypothetical protein F6K55_38480 [Moorea sp. SIO4A3]|nr:hypothetical protein [Moorena sp. SIO4A3]
MADMKIYQKSFFNQKLFIIVLLLSVGVTLLSSCSPNKMEKCKLIEVEPREVELDIKDTDIEGWELEVLCGDQLWDIPWSEINRHFKIDLKKYYSKNPQAAQRQLQRLEQRLVFYKQDNKRGNILYGSLDSNPELVGVKAKKDD